MLRPDRITSHRPFAATSLVGLTALLGACATPASLRTAAPVEVGIIAINDFHGNLEPPRQTAAARDSQGRVASVPVGGAAYLASAIDAIRARYPHHLTVSAGDLVGGSPITSSLFMDEPAIGVMNRIGLDFNAVGNHEFDSGVPELRRKQEGGCAQHTLRQPCQLEAFKGAQFPFLAANVSVKESGKTLFPGTALRSFGKGRNRVTVGLIGMTLQGTSALVPSEVSDQVAFLDEAETANRLVEGLKKQGADAVVVMIHQGGRTTSPDPDNCADLTGEIRPVLDKLDPRVDLVVSGHTHWPYVCDYGQYNPARPFLLTSAGPWGGMVTEIALRIDPAMNRVVARNAHNRTVQSEPFEGQRGRVEIDPDMPRYAARADIAQYVARYSAAAKEYADRKVGYLAAGAEKSDPAMPSAGGPLGNLIADAQLAATRSAGAQIALMNPFGIRRGLVPAADGTVTFGDIYAVQPFNNQLVIVSLTGAELREILEQGFDDNGPEQILTPSEGFAYAFDRTRPAGQRIVSITLDGQPLDPAQTYRVSASTFLGNGGDTFTSFAKGRDRTVGITDLAALESWLKSAPGRMPPSARRTTDSTPR